MVSPPESPLPYPRSSKAPANRPWTPPSRTKRCLSSYEPRGTRRTRENSVGQPSEPPNGSPILTPHDQYSVRVSRLRFRIARLGAVFQRTPLFTSERHRTNPSKGTLTFPPASPHP